MVVLGLPILAMLVVADRKGFVHYHWVMDLSPEQRAAYRDMSRYDGRTVRVLRVVDAASLTIDLHDADSQPTHVQLWAIEPPRLTDGDGAGETHAEARWADAAHRRAQALVGGQLVTLRLVGGRTRDDDGRLLAYVELGDGSVLNEQLLVEGLATLVDRWPHPQAERYSLLGLQARRSHVGQWTKEP